MDYQFRPFGIGVVMSDVEVEVAKQHIKSKMLDLRAACIAYSFVGAEFVLRHTVNGLQAVADVSQSAAYELADVHTQVVFQLSMIKEGEVLDSEGQRLFA
jgi:hypothetical protein